MLSFGMVGLAKVRFNEVLLVSSKNRAPSPRNISRTLRQMILPVLCSFGDTLGMLRTTAFRRLSRHAAKLASHAPYDAPHSATAGQPAPFNQPTNARTSAIVCAIVSMAPKYPLECC